MSNDSTVKTSLKGQTYIDYSYDSLFRTETGVLVTYEGIEAVRNALILWLYSFKGERMRQPERGGYVTRWLFKPLTEDTAENIEFAILQGLENDFGSALKITQVTANPDFENDSWIIEVKAYLPTSKKEIYVIENIRRVT